MEFGVLPVCRYAQGMRAIDAGEQRPMASGGDLDGGGGVVPVAAGGTLHGASPK
jgi:hypothetical protein